jgi:predicted RNA-binding protein Jag
MPLKVTTPRVLKLRVAKEDVGKVIGKQGRTARALRILIGAVSAKIKNARPRKSWNRQYYAWRKIKCDEF